MSGKRYRGKNDNFMITEVSEITENNEFIDDLSSALLVRNLNAVFVEMANRFSSSRYKMSLRYLQKDKYLLTFSSGRKFIVRYVR